MLNFVNVQAYSRKQNIYIYLHKVLEMMSFNL
jgi:hypothetical protein